MHDEAGAAAEDRVKFVFAVEAEALLAAVLEAREAIAVIPAPRALGHVAGQRSGVADLRCAYLPCGLGKHCVLAVNERMLAQRVERDQPADLDLAALLGHL